MSDIRAIEEKTKHELDEVYLPPTRFHFNVYFLDELG